MSATPTIRRGTVGDAAMLAEFGARMFEEAFGLLNRPEDTAAHLATTFGLPQQTAELTSADVVTLIAELEGTMVGYAQVRRSTPPACAAEEVLPVEVHRVYVDRAWHGKGVAEPLLKSALNAARELGGRTAWLSVWQRNPRAIAFYMKHGFRRVGGADFWVGTDRQIDNIMTLHI